MEYTIKDKKLMLKLISNEISFDEFIVTSIKNNLFLSKDELIEKLLLTNEIDFLIFYKIISYYKMNISHKKLEFLLGTTITTNTFLYLCSENDIELPKKDILKQLFLKNYIDEEMYSKMIAKKIAEPISEEELYSYIIEYYNGFEILIKSIKYNLINGIKYALNNGYDIKMYKTLVLGIALSNKTKSFEVIKLLLENGAFVNDDVMEIARINSTDNNIMLLLKSHYKN